MIDIIENINIINFKHFKKQNKKETLISFKYGEEKKARSTNLNKRTIIHSLIEIFRNTTYVIRSYKFESLIIPVYPIVKLLIVCYIITIRWIKNTDYDFGRLRV